MPPHSCEFLKIEKENDFITVADEVDMPEPNLLNVRRRPRQPNQDEEDFLDLVMDHRRRRAAEQILLEEVIHNRPFGFPFEIAWNDEVIEVHNLANFDDNALPIADGEDMFEELARIIGANPLLRDPRVAEVIQGGVGQGPDQPFVIRREFERLQNVPNALREELERLMERNFMPENLIDFDPENPDNELLLLGNALDELENEQGILNERPIDVEPTTSTNDSAQLDPDHIHHHHHHRQPAAEANAVVTAVIRPLTRVVEAHPVNNANLDDDEIIDVEYE